MSEERLPACLTDLPDEIGDLPAFLSEVASYMGVADEPYVGLTPLTRMHLEGLMKDRRKIVSAVAVVLKAIDSVGVIREECLPEGE